MKILNVFALRGPNMWANFPVLEAWVDLEELKDSPSDILPGFNDRLMAWMPSMIEHRCSIGERGGFFQRLRNGTWQGHILEHVTLELQTLAGTPVGFGKARETSVEGIYKVIIRYQDEELGRACLNTAFELCQAAVHDRPFDVQAEIDKLRLLADRICLGPSTLSIVDAARQQGIPFRRLNSGSFVQFGYGSRQRRIWTAETDQTGAIAESIAQDKDLTKGLLSAVGVPVPEGRPVSDPDDAWAAACEVGTPVVVKPRDGNHGRAVCTNLTTRDQVRAAFAPALKEGSGVLVERFVPGVEHRLLVVGGKLVAASQGDTVHAFGDGVRTVNALIEEVNRDPRRGEVETCPLNPIELDAVVLLTLERQGYTPDSIPAAGSKVLLKLSDNLATDVTDLVHPEVADRAVLAAEVVGLDIAGIDVVAEDISRPLEDQAGAIVEVNAGPGLLMHLKPSVGTPRPVGEAIISMLYPGGATGRIPILAVTGTNGKTIVTRLLSHLLHGFMKTIGMTCSEGIYIDGRRQEAGDCSGPRSARKVLLNPRVDAAVFEVARGGLLREGLGFDRCQVAVVTNVGEGDHLGLHDIQDLEKMTLVKRTIVDVVLPTGTAVLNAADPLVAGMAEHCRGSVLFFSPDGLEAVLVEHRARGGRAVFASDGWITLAEGAEETPLVALADVPLTRGGRIPFQVENALAAAAGAWAAGVSLESIRQGLLSFVGGFDEIPARFNVFPFRGGTVIFDDAHNASALTALIRALDEFPQDRRSIVFSASGDRRDSDILRQGELLGKAFDRVVLYEACAAGERGEGEVAALLRQALASGDRVSEILAAGQPLTAAETALEMFRPGELLVIQSDDVDETAAFIRAWLADAAAEKSEAASSAAEVNTP